MRNNSLYKFAITSIILILALSVSGWGECRDDYLGTTHTSDVAINCKTGFTASCAGATYVGVGSDGYCIAKECRGGVWHTLAIVICYTQAEGDSVRCALNPSDPSCCDAHCECGKAGGTWHPNGYCVKDCQTEACCDSLNVPQVAYDSVYIWQNNTCALHWRCESPQAECVAINGLLVADVLPDTTTQDGTTTITNKCYYNCGRVIPSDSSKSMVDGNIVLPSSASLISQGIKTPNPFDAIRSEDNGEYTYDFLSPQAGHYLDSIAFTPCVQTLYRCVLNGKYVYYYDNQTAPSGCTNIVKIK